MNFADLQRRTLAAAQQHYSRLTRPETNVVIDCVLREIASALARADAVKLRGLGVFAVIDVPARQTRNPKTGEKREKPARQRVRFRPSQALESMI